MILSSLKKYFAYFLGASLVAWSVRRAYYFTLQNWTNLWPNPVLAIDGNSYLSGALRLASGAGIFPIPDIYHSPGYQYFLGFLFWLGGSTENGIALNKLSLLLFFILSVFLTFFIARKIYGRGVAVIAGLLLSCSISWLYYSQMLQYEVLVGFLLLAWLASAMKTQKGLAGDFAVRLLSGFLLLVLIFVHGRFIFLIVAPMWEAFDFWRKQDLRRLRNQLVSLFAVLAPTFAWSIIYSRLFGHLIWIMDRREMLFRMGNNPNSVGLGFPHPIIIEPSGFAFIFHEPLRFLWLIGQRFLYLWGIKPDVWALPPDGGPRTVIQAVIYSVACLGFHLGIFFSWKKREKIGHSGQWKIYLALVGVIGPLLMLYGNYRLLVPIIPLMAIFQAVAIMELWGWYINRPT